MAIFFSLFKAKQNTCKRVLGYAHVHLFVTAMLTKLSPVVSSDWSSLWVCANDVALFTQPDLSCKV